jgi:catechol 2,3-dioxygenase-like lactoylglutathione lyase family enzyme
MPAFKPELTLAVTVSDYKKAAEWYTSKLGFQNVYSVDEVGWGEFTSPVTGVTIGLGTARPGETISRDGGATITFGVPDIEAARSELEGKGVPFDGPTDVLPGLVKLATFRDPDGNAFMLAESLQQQG